MESTSELKLPDDFDEIIAEAHRQGWVFICKEKIWKQDYMRSRTTAQLYNYIKKQHQKLW